MWNCGRAFHWVGLVVVTSCSCTALTRQASGWWRTSCSEKLNLFVALHRHHCDVSGTGGRSGLQSCLITMKFVLITSVIYSGDFPLAFVFSERSNMFDSAKCLLLFCCQKSKSSPEWKHGGWRNCVQCLTLLITCAVFHGGKSVCRYWQHWAPPGRNDAKQVLAEKHEWVVWKLVRIIRHFVEAICVKGADDCWLLFYCHITCWSFIASQSVLFRQAVAACTRIRLAQEPDPVETRLPPHPICSPLSRKTSHLRCSSPNLVSAGDVLQWRTLQVTYSNDVRCRWCCEHL